jgi:hypothetical protein
MPRKTLLLALFFAASLLQFPAQQASQVPTPQDRPAFASGITVPAIPRAPFSATVVIEVQRDWADDSSEIVRTINLIARDSRGRTHNETRRLMPESFHGSPQLLQVRLYDPATHIRTILDPALRIARQELISEAPKTTSPENPLVHSEDLGTDTFNGIPARGTRRTVVVSKPLFGWGKPTVVEDEEWYAQALQLMLLLRHTDPRVGVQTLGVSGLKREEPPASMFEVPKGYKIVAVPRLPATPAEPVPPVPGTGTQQEPPL